jgi:hypothetical protein
MVDLVSVSYPPVFLIPRSMVENHIFDYGNSNAADLMRTTQEKIAQYDGIKYGEDIANELTNNKNTVTVAPPVYSAAILLRNQEWEDHVRKKQKNTKTALDAKLRQLRAAATVDRDVVVIADTENLIDDVEARPGGTLQPY